MGWPKSNGDFSVWMVSSSEPRQPDREAEIINNVSENANPNLRKRIPSFLFEPIRDLQFPVLRQRLTRIDNLLVSGTERFGALANQRET